MPELTLKDLIKLEEPKVDDIKIKVFYFCNLTKT